MVGWNAGPGNVGHHDEHFEDVSRRTCSLESRRCERSFADRVAEQSCAPLVIARDAGEQTARSTDTFPGSKPDQMSVLERDYFWDIRRFRVAANKSEDAAPIVACPNWPILSMTGSSRSPAADASVYTAKKLT